MENLDFEIIVKTALIKKKMRNLDIAKKLGLSESYVSDIIRGNRKANHHKRKICEILEIPFISN